MTQLLYHKGPVRYDKEIKQNVSLAKFMITSANLCEYA